MVTLSVYLLFTVATAFAWNFAIFAAFRVLAGSGIGGEYAALNSAIDELIPARVRGRVALAINGSWWVGAVGSALASYALLNWMSTSIGWRLGFGIGATLALCILAIRRFIPESPPLAAHPRARRRGRAAREHRLRLDREVRGGGVPGRGVLGLSLMTGQAFLYNAIFFTYTL